MKNRWTILLPALAWRREARLFADNAGAASPPPAPVKPAAAGRTVLTLAAATPKRLALAVNKSSEIFQ